ncbi:AMP-binding protein [Gordonia crocea]|uniref:Acyl-CoA synthetase n=1 Tax=Gordonia crocea TaxID=589162 RepID=A0A7I9V024_9ACTN|nr:AMP-binding protein [Gordonia crocea]GED98615.1 acyl-CoA synthetase [Gordonia crocea]GED98777.1 acyl-CoA synthetase [Gordonia crocea]GED99303.1 acyl-CoA synthetase [Gordonia crocea]
MTALRNRLSHYAWIVRVLVSSGFLTLLRPDRYLRMGLSLRRQGGTNAVSGIGLAAAQYPDAVALHDEAGSLTWAQLDARADALAVGLSESTVRPPRTVAIMCRNHRGIVEAIAATIRLGADAVLLNTGFAGPQLADVLKREQADILIADDEFAGLIDHARQSDSGLRCLWSWQEGIGLRADPGTVEHLISSRMGQRPAPPRKPGRIILLTSGTTGTPKGAKRGASGSDVSSLAAMLDRIPWRGGETTVIAAPIFHAWGFGQMAISSTMHATMVMRRRFDPQGTLDLVRDHGASGLAVVPVMLERIMDLPVDVLDAKPMPTLRFATASGSRMRAESLTAFMDRFGDVVYNSYNATEAGLISTATPADLRIAPDTAGRPIAGTRVRILDDDRRPLPVGEIGVIAVANESAFDGYTGTETKDYADGYMLSGDVGRIDGNGLLYVVGRDDEMIVSGGENVYPLEVELVLDAHPGVAEVAVIGVDDEKFGQRLAAFVVRSGGSDVDADALKAHVKSQLAGYKVPRDIHFIELLPRNATGKVLKRDLTEEGR